MRFFFSFSLSLDGEKKIVLHSIDTGRRRRRTQKKKKKKKGKESARNKQHAMPLSFSLSFSSSSLLLLFLFFSVFVVHFLLLLLGVGFGRRRKKRNANTNTSAKKKIKKKQIKIKRGRAPTGPPKCVAFAFGADVLFASSLSEFDDEKTRRFKALLRDTLTFWALDDIKEECESMVLYFDGFGGGKEEEEMSSLMVVLEECFASLSSSHSKDGIDGDERGTRRREVRVKRYASSSGEMETIGEYVLCCCARGCFDEKGEGEMAGGEGNCEVDEDVVVVANGGAAARRRRRRRSAVSAASSPERTDPENKKNKKNEKKKNAPMMDVIVLTSATGYDILSSFARSLRTKRGRAPLKTDEEKEAFLSSLVSSSSSPSPLSSPPATVALIERELKTNFLKNQLPTPELLVVVSDVFSVGKFPGFLLSKCELAHFAPPPASPSPLQSAEEKKKTRGGDDDAAATLARHRKILGEYLRSFQRFGA